MSKKKTNVNPLLEDVNSKTIFENPTLCRQFLKDNVDMPGFENITEDDIEDVTARFVSYFGVEFNADTIKRVHIRPNGEETDVYVISLIDHKSRVDYNVSVQLLKYMACIWAEYEKTFIRNGGDRDVTRNKSFKYPPILPIVYYEGADRWTADIHLKDRIMMSDVFGKYIPDYEYMVVRNHDYTNEELLARRDEMSLLMIINKIQTAADISEFLKLPADEINKIIQESPQEVINIIAAVVGSLCDRVNATQKEKHECVKKVVRRQMGYLFENMEKMDIQAERRKTEKATRRADALQTKLTDTETKLTDTEMKLTDTETKLNNAENKIAELEAMIESFKKQ